MANTNGPFGLRPAYHLGGGVIRLEGRTIADQYANDLFRGDPIKSTGTGRNIQIGTAGGTILGVFWGCEYTKSDGEHVIDDKWPTGTALLSGTTAVAHCYVDPQIVYRAQASGSIVEADIGLLADLASGTGNAATHLSGWTVGGHDGSEAQVKILGLSRTPPANEYGNYADIDVLIMEHELRGAGTEV